MLVSCRAVRLKSALTNAYESLPSDRNRTVIQRAEALSWDSLRRRSALCFGRKEVTNVDAAYYLPRMPCIMYMQSAKDSVTLTTISAISQKVVAFEILMQSSTKRNQLGLKWLYKKTEGSLASWSQLVLDTRTLLEIRNLKNTDMRNWKIDYVHYVILRHEWTS